MATDGKTGNTRGFDAELLVEELRQLNLATRDGRARAGIIVHDIEVMYDILEPGMRINLAAIIQHIADVYWQSQRPITMLDRLAKILRVGPQATGKPPFDPDMGSSNKVVAACE